MQALLHAVASVLFSAATTNYKPLRVLVLVGIMLLCQFSASASHFRYGNVSWRWVSGNTVEFKISQSWRYTAFYAEIGQTVNPGDFDFGDGAQTALALKVTAANKVDDWMYGEAIITKTYNNAGNYNAYFTGCCRVSYLKNNADGNWNVQTTVTIGNGNSAPVTTLPAIVNLPQNKSDASFQMPVTDPDGDNLTFRLATKNEMGGGHNPVGLTVNPATGIISFSTVGKQVGDMYNAAITVLDSRGAKVTTDFVILITEESAPPVFDYSITPVNKTVLQVAPGQTIAFNVKAHDTDPGDKVTMLATGLPAGASQNPALPATGNPVQSAFSWTPTAANLGTHVVNFIAQDIKGVQATSSITIQVSYKPVFDVPPTPVLDSRKFTVPGQTINLTIQASDPDQNDKVIFTELKGLPDEVATLPTIAANPIKMHLNWTPETKHWGTNNIIVKARDTNNDEVSHSFKIIVNTPPVFTSLVPQQPIVAGYEFNYNITAHDDDLAFGDQLGLIALQLPDWLTLNDLGNGEAVLRGTPQLSHVGEHNITLIAEDKWHHNGGLAEQKFKLTVTDPRCGDKNEKVLVCHAGQTICVPVSTVQEHLAHGCYIGSCKPGTPSETIIDTAPLVAYPNPFTNVTTLAFTLPVAGKYKIELVDARGLLVTILRQGAGDKGQYFVLEAIVGNLKPGIYLVRLITGAGVQHVKVVKQ